MQNKYQLHGNQINLDLYIYIYVSRKKTAL